jgi:hypothetical protein
MANTPTLADVNSAMAAVTAALRDNSISSEMEDALNSLWNALQAMQDAIIEDTEKDLVTTLAAQNAELLQLNDKINKLASDLDKTSATINKVSTTLGTIISVIAGLI